MLHTKPLNLCENAFVLDREPRQKSDASDVLVNIPIPIFEAISILTHILASNHESNDGVFKFSHNYGADDLGVEDVDCVIVENSTQSGRFSEAENNPVLSELREVPESKLHTGFPHKQYSTPNGRAPKPSHDDLLVEMARDEEGDILYNDWHSPLLTPVKQTTLKRRENWGQNKVINGIPADTDNVIQLVIDISRRKEYVAAIKSDSKSDECPPTNVTRGRVGVGWLRKIEG